MLGVNWLQCSVLWIYFRDDAGQALDWMRRYCAWLDGPGFENKLQFQYKQRRMIQANITHKHTHTRLLLGEEFSIFFKLRLVRV